MADKNLGDRNVIDQIIDIEYAAKEIVAKALEDRRNIDRDVEALRDALGARIQSEAQTRLEKLKNDENSSHKRDMEELEVAHKRMLESMEKKFKAHKKAWISQVVENVLGVVGE